MARLIYSGTALADLERRTDFVLEQHALNASQAVDPSETVELIIEAVELLENHPLVGRPVEAGLRELVISRSRTGYMALYAVEANEDVVLVLSIRHQTEAGYPQ